MRPVNLAKATDMYEGKGLFKWITDRAEDMKA
jgi:hypothetical protein